MKFIYESSTLLDQNLTAKSKNYCGQMLEENKYQRGDYQYVGQLVYILLPGWRLEKSQTLSSGSPLLYQEARFMSDCLFTLDL